MNIGLVTSYVVGGIILLSLLYMNINLSRSSAELSILERKKQHLTALSEIISSDFPKMGYNRTTSIDSAAIIQYADSNRVRFYSNIDNSADESVETIEWEYTNTPVAATDNPNDYKLLRTVNGVSTEINLGVTKFELKYYSSFGSNSEMSTPVSSGNLDDIRQIEVVVVMESDQKLQENVFSNGRYVKTAWEKRFSPRNLIPN